MNEMFDEKALLETVDGDIAFLDETVSMLDEDSPALLESIQHAAKARDAAALVGPAHAIKSMLGNFCAGPAQEAARRVEVMGRENQLDEVDAAVQTLQQATLELKEALKAFVKARQS